MVSAEPHSFPFLGRPGASEIPSWQEGVPSLFPSGVLEVTCRVWLISINEPDRQNPTHLWPSFLEAPRLTVRMKPDSHLPSSISLMGGLFMSPFECSGHANSLTTLLFNRAINEWLQYNTLTASHPSLATQPWSQWDTHCQVWFTQ